MMSLNDSLLKRNHWVKMLIVLECGGEILRNSKIAGKFYLNEHVNLLMRGNPYRLNSIPPAASNIKAMPDAT